ncbi:Rossmann-like alpha/beta/alpha sandwich fold-containing protein [Dioscorea alata]|uniref:Rossmann-like alpha/beta/alpha sandwich fold-containing protein n=1 Tax=Dioscorea alata TaxID=55571 RepID=A0ACB7V0J8_DIOAL|nr:Rossmann-like alpha/beta/alpha sandwich fold-containing protein [Dioscorea alata]
MNKRMLLLPYVKASEAASDLASAADFITMSEQSSSTGENVQKSAFPNGFEVAMQLYFNFSIKYKYFFFNQETNCLSKCTKMHSRE